MEITFLRGEYAGAESLTISTLLSEATRNTASPFSLHPPPTTKGVEPKRSRGGVGRGGGTTGSAGGETSSSSNPMRDALLFGVSNKLAVRWGEGV